MTGSTILGTKLLQVGKNLSNELAKNTDLYKIPTAIPKEVADFIIKQYSELEHENPTVNVKNPRIDTSIRKCKVRGLHTDCWVAGMMAHFVHCANKQTFKYDLKQWSNLLQFLVYDEPGDHYEWHCDAAKDEFNSEYIRKLTAILCLSSKDDYEGGELEIAMTPTDMVDGFANADKIKLDIGEVIIFPTDSLHKVHPLISGTRSVLIGWMGGPKFK